MNKQHSFDQQRMIRFPSMWCSCAFVYAHAADHTSELDLFKRTTAMQEQVRMAQGNDDAPFESCAEGENRKKVMLPHV